MAEQNTAPGAAEKPNGSAAASSSTAQSNPSATASGSSDAKAKAPPRGYPIFRAIGFPNFRLRLPSRNWLIFLSITGSWTAAYLYDRRERKRVQKKWCDVVSHIAQETLPQQNMMPRRVTIFLASPPGDGITPIRDHFREYIKPVLVAGAMDWDVIEGRREGEVRVGLAERIRKLRKAYEGAKKSGVPGELDLEDGDVEALVKTLRTRSGVREWEGVQGDIVIGRHTWKEYVHGLHEGWLGPLEQPSPPNTSSPLDLPPSDAPAGLESPNTAAESPAEFAASGNTEAVPSTENQTEEKKKEDEKKEEAKPPPKPPVPAAYISPSEYTGAALAPSTPEVFTPATIIPFPHILGFLNTPIRMYRFLNKRYLADDTGRQTAAAVLAAYRSFHGSESASHPTEFSTSTSTTDISSDGSTVQAEGNSQTLTDTEQQRLLIQEEKDWPKHVRRPKDPTSRQYKQWTDPMVLEPRIAERMRRFEVAADEEARAERIGRGLEGPIQVKKPGDFDANEESSISGEA